jgi:predicted TPR repeat methyltransferase
MVDHFKDRADKWESGIKGDTRIAGAKVIADAIKKRFTLTKDMRIMDFGVGTGLLGFDIAKMVKEVVGVDTSIKMLEQLQDKNSLQLRIEPLNRDIIQNPISDKFDGIVSSMTLHHIEDLELFFSTIYNNLNNDGFIAIADLELEDGSFHSNNEGVFHFGFDTEILTKIVENIGFKNVICENINSIKKPHKEFGVLLLSAKK